MKNIVRDIISGEKDLEAQEVIDTILIPCNDLYHSGVDDSPISDSEYDQLYTFIKSQAPSNPFFLGTGSDIRGGKVKLPYPMGSLDQVQTDEVSQWIENNDLFFDLLTVTEKLDGISCQLVYDHKGEFQIAYSRGNGLMGADITRHLRKIKSFPHKINISNVVIRAEIIFPKKSLNKVQSLVKTKSGKKYKNLRNMIAGLMNSKTTIQELYDQIHVVAFDIINKDLDKEQQLKELENNGFIIPDYQKIVGNDVNADLLTNTITINKKSGRYEIDGVVIDVNSFETRKTMSPSRDTLNPAFSVKFKIVDGESVRQVKVEDVMWNVSKHGYLKPKIVLETFDLNGVTINFATGFNAKFICDNKIGKGAIVEIVRSGDVIPFCRKVIKGADEASLPSPDIGEYQWNETYVDFVLLENNEEVFIQQLIDFSTSMEIDGLREGSIRKLVNERHLLDVTDLLMLDQQDFLSVLGINGNKIFDSLQTVLSDLPLWKLMGSVSTFGRGIGKRKVKKLLESLHYVDHKVWTVEKIAEIDSFDIKTADKILSNINLFDELLKKIEKVANIRYDVNRMQGSLSDKKICFTGFRDNNLQQSVEKQGGVVVSGVSSKTNIVVAADINGKSSKLDKARQLGISIITKDEMENMLNV